MNLILGFKIFTESSWIPFNGSVTEIGRLKLLLFLTLLSRRMSTTFISSGDPRETRVYRSIMYIISREVGLNVIKTLMTRT